MRVTVTLLSDSTASAYPFKAEYGFAALVEVDGVQYLYDSGSGEVIFPNAKQLKIELAEIPTLIISHGHYDHTASALALAKLGGLRQIYIHPQAFADRFRKNPDGSMFANGCVFSREEIQAEGVELRMIEAPVEISPKIWILGEVPRRNDLEDAGGNFVLKVGEALEPDEVIDDMPLVIDHPKGLIVLSGCAHSGLINIFTRVGELFPEKKIQAFIGGTHLINAGTKRMEATIQALRKWDVQLVVTCHCTGFKAAAKLYQALPDRIQSGATGLKYIF